MYKQNITKLGLNRKLGQFFTPSILVDQCIALIENKNGRLLEPSCGNLAFKNCMHEDSIFIEIDKNIINDNKVLNIDFLERIYNWWKIYFFSKSINGGINI